MAKLIVNPTSSNRREISLSRSTLLAIGRDPSNDLVLPDAMVSRRHAVVEWRGSQFFLRDCNSSNGSVVNGDRVSERLLRDGDLVAIGTARLLFRDDLAEPGAKVVHHPSSPKLQCPACQAEYRKGDLFCRECGEKIASASGPPKVICASCGTAVTLPARFCSACGAAIAREEDKADVPAPAAPDAGPPAPPASSPPAMKDTRPASAPFPALDSDEPATGPPTPAPVLEAPLEARPGGGAVAAPAIPVRPMPAATEPKPEVAENAEAVPESRPRPEPAPREEKARAEPKLRSDEKPRPVESSRSDERHADRARSGDRLRSTRPGEVAAAPARSAAPDHPPASFGVRLLSGLADALVLGAAEAVVLAPVFYYWSGRAVPRTAADVSFLPILVSVVLVPLAGALGAAYYVYSWGVRGATLGQGFFELVVESDDGARPIGAGRAALRFVGYLLSLASLGVGFLMIAFTGSGLHDRIAGTRVVRGRIA
jgi:uncharacterized RDD family membrane protein YckC